MPDHTTAAAADYLPPSLLTVTQLRNLYPAVFAHGDRPLKIGICEDMMAAHPAVPRKTLRMLLGSHTSRPPYLRSLAAGGPRYALDGTVAGEVTEAEQAQAREALARLDDPLHGDSGLARKARSALLKAFEASGMPHAEFAQARHIELPALHSQLDRAKTERAKRQQERENIVAAFKESKLSPEAFSKLHRMPIGRVMRALSRLGALPAAMPAGGEA